MDTFTLVKGLAAPLDRVNVDTDQIIPKQYLKTIKRTGLREGLFSDWRYTSSGETDPSFFMNQPRYRNAVILVAGDNFGCGSSREHAPWALLDYGLRCVIAPSFADIFFNNCFKNGMLPVVLTAAEVAQLIKEIEASPGYELSVDLAVQTVTTPSGTTFRFAVDPFRKECLLNGLDEIGLTLRNEANITAYEQQHRQAAPWLFLEDME